MNPSYELNAVNASCQKLQNLYPEVIESGDEKAIGYLRCAPGLSLPLVTLPTLPVRAIAEVGSAIYGSRMFAVGGSKLYEVFAATVSVNGTSVTLVSGDPFTAAMANQPIGINGVMYAVSGAPGSSSSLTLTTSAGVQTSVAAGWYAKRGYSGTVTVSGAVVTWASGQQFVAAMANQQITIAGEDWKIVSVDSATQLTLSTTGASSGAYTTGDDIGNDGLPAQLIPNGNQCGVASNGQWYCDNGVGPFPIKYPGNSYTDLVIGWAGVCDVVGPFVTDTGGWAGTVTASGTTVTRVTGPPFYGGLTGAKITIATTTYTVVSVDPGHSTLTIDSSAGTISVATGYSVTGASDRPFNAGMLNMGITLTGVGPDFQILQVNSSTGLTVNTPRSAKSLGIEYFIAASTFIVSSQIHPFTSADIGSTLDISSGGGWNGGTYTVLDVDDYGNATLGQDGATVPLGTLGSVGGQATQNFGPVLARSAAFLDSFFVLNPPNTTTLQVTAPLDGTTVDPSETASKESHPDKIAMLLADHQELLVLGDATSEVWAAPGPDPTFPYGPNEAYAMPLGTKAPWATAALRDGPVFIGSSQRGGPIAYCAKGFQPERISTHAIEQVWAKFTTVADAVGFVFELNGHEFWQISFPSADQTWLYDRTTSLQLQKPIWFERTSYDGSAQHRHRAACAAYVFGATYAGDYQNGNIYLMSGDIHTDNGQPITYVRTLPHICSERLRQFFSKLQLDLETGAQAFTIVLEWSDDGGTTWVGGGSAFSYTTSTATNLDRAVFWQLGSADDRVFRITVTGAGQVALINAYLDAMAGIS